MTGILISIQHTGSKGESLNLSHAEDSYKALDSDSEGAYSTSTQHCNYRLRVNTLDKVQMY